jgi:ketosteroid isomerase-like protein
MSQENVEIVRQANEAFNRGDVAAWTACFDPNVVYVEGDAYLDTPPVVRGRETLVRATWQFQEMFEDFRGDLEEVIDAGAWIVTVTHWRGSGAGSGASVDRRETIAWRIEAGLLIEGRVFANTQAALEAVAPSD